MSTSVALMRFNVKTEAPSALEASHLDRQTSRQFYFAGLPTQIARPPRGHYCPVGTRRIADLSCFDGSDCSQESALASVLARALPYLSSHSPDESLSPARGLGVVTCVLDLVQGWQSQLQTRFEWMLNDLHPPRGTVAVRQLGFQVPRRCACAGSEASI
jgi:hypothetical protein